jgi:hypothetical protein
MKHKIDSMQQENAAQKHLIEQEIQRVQANYPQSIETGSLASL